MYLFYNENQTVLAQMKKLTFNFSAYLEDGVLQTDSVKLRQHYMNSTTFYIDLLCLLPLDFLYLSLEFQVSRRMMVVVVVVVVSVVVILLLLMIMIALTSSIYLILVFQSMLRVCRLVKIYRFWEFLDRCAS